MDSIDKKILRFLIQNARTPFLEIARECGISGAAIHQRIKKLEDMGVIQGFDMTSEAAMTKLMWALGQGKSPEEIKKLFEISLAGEITV